MQTKSIFNDVDIYERHYAILVAETLAGGKSDLDDRMLDAVYACNEHHGNMLSSSDIDILINHKLVNMFERNEDGMAVSSSYVITETLRTAGGKVGNIVVQNNFGEKTSSAASAFIANKVKISEPTIGLYNYENGEPLKFGMLKPVLFKDTHGNTLTRYVEVFYNVSMSFCIESIYGTNAWPAIWKIAESNGIGGARYHGYGKFAVVDWS